MAGGFTGGAVGVPGVCGAAFRPSLARSSFSPGASVVRLPSGNRSWMACCGRLPSCRRTEPSGSTVTGASCPFGWSCRGVPCCRIVSSSLLRVGNDICCSPCSPAVTGGYAPGVCWVLGCGPPPFSWMCRSEERSTRPLGGTGSFCPSGNCRRMPPCGTLPSGSVTIPLGWSMAGARRPSGHMKVRPASGLGGLQVSICSAPSDRSGSARGQKAIVSNSTQRVACLMHDPFVMEDVGGLNAS